MPLVSVGKPGSPYIPVVLDRLDDESERRADTVDILVHDLLHNGRLSRVVQTPDAVSPQVDRQFVATHSMRMRISLSFRRAFRNIESILRRSIPENWVS